MLLQRTERIAVLDVLWVAGITSEFVEPLDDGSFKLPYMRRPQGPHPLTGLWMPSVLKCAWRTTVQKSAIIEIWGHVPTAILEPAMEWIKADVQRLKREGGK
jgi:hypothetical protein